MVAAQPSKEREGDGFGWRWEKMHIESQSRQSGQHCWLVIGWQRSEAVKEDLDEQQQTGGAVAVCV